MRRVWAYLRGLLKINVLSIYGKEKDELGRIVITKALREKLGVIPKDSIEIYTENSCIILKKYESRCIFWYNSNKLTEYKEKLICQKCLKELNKLLFNCLNWYDNL